MPTHSHTVQHLGTPAKDVDNATLVDHDMEPDTTNSHVRTDHTLDFLKSFAKDNITADGNVHVAGRRLKFVNAEQYRDSLKCVLLWLLSLC
jgi:hypothetical protein